MALELKLSYRRSRLLVAVAIAISLISVACSSGKQQTNQASSATPADLEAINQLRQHDVEASKAWDVETLVSLWTDDIVSIPQDGQPVIGKEANRNSLLKLKEASKDIDIAEYNMAFNELKVIGDWAFEWGTFTGTIKSKDGGETLQSSGKLFRVLKRDADGSWKVARSMYSNDSLDESEDATPE
jgi:uncharacterized protein (TIGR02246 family)